MARDPAVAAPALRKLLRATGITPGNAFFPRGGDDSPWCNPSVRARDTLATCELDTDRYFGAQSPAHICLRVLPAEPGRSFPTSCVISLSTSSQRMDELAMEDVIVKEWVMTPTCKSSSAWVETTLAVQTVYHIACLVGREPTADTRVFLTLRFTGCCDMSDTHRIAAVEMFYTSLRPLQRPPQASASPTSREAIEVELALSPTPMRGHSGTLDRPARSPPAAQFSRMPERVIVADGGTTPRDSPARAALQTPAPTIQKTTRGGTDHSEPEAHARWDGRAREGGKWEESSEDDLKCEGSPYCVLKEYEVTSLHSLTSPPRRSVTAPRHIVYLNAGEESEDNDVSKDHECHGMRSLSSDGVVELLTSPCTTRSSSARPPRPPVAASAAPVRLVEHSVTMDTSSAEPHAVPLACRAPFVVPDRRDFVPVDCFRSHQPQRGPYTLWGDDGDTPTRGVHIESRADVTEGRRRIRSLRNVPLCGVADDLLCAATALLGVGRESLCGRSSLASSSCRDASASIINESKTNDRRESKVNSHTERKELQRLLSVEVSEPTPPLTATPSLLQRPRPPHGAECAAPLLLTQAGAQRAPRRWRSIVEDPRALQMPKAEKHDETSFCPLTDRTPELNHLPLPKPDKTAFLRTLRKEEPSVVHANVAPAAAGCPISEACDISVESTAESEGPSLVVQVEPLMPPPPPPGRQFVPPASTLPSYRGNSMSIAPVDDVSVQPLIGTFLVWKHHISRSGTAKRILSLQRDGDCVLVTLKKIEHGKKSAQAVLRSSDDIEVITSMRAYHSNAIHANHVHVAECCLVVTRGGELVMAVEMQCVDELRLATQILRYVSRIGAT